MGPAPAMNAVVREFTRGSSNVSSAMEAESAIAVRVRVVVRIVKVQVNLKSLNACTAMEMDSA